MHTPTIWKSLSNTTKFNLVIIFILSIIGLFFVLVFIGMQLNLFTVKGSIDERNTALHQTTSSHSDANKPILFCKTSLLNTHAPDTAQTITDVLRNPNNTELATTMLRYASRNYMNDSVFMRSWNNCNTNPTESTDPNLFRPRTAYNWANSTEWATLKIALTRDKKIIEQAARDADINPRYIISGVIGEQFRFFAGVRTAFKNYFEPLKIFGRLSKFSYGIAGLKPDTVRRIENNLMNPKSVFYLGTRYERFANYSDAEIHRSNDPQLTRITDPDNNYYSYLYVGLYMRQVAHQWEQSGYPITDNPGVLATLYNLGFNRSLPKPNPLPGGAEIVIDGREYTFGQIGEEFYWSGELINEFPY